MGLLATAGDEIPSTFAAIRPEVRVQEYGSNYLQSDALLDLRLNAW